MKDKKKKCYLYVRVSTTMQVEGYNLEAQKDRLTKYADFQNMEIVREYSDAGKSGKNITGRPEFSQMLQDVADDRDGVDYFVQLRRSCMGKPRNSPKSTTFSGSSISIQALIPFHPSDLYEIIPAVPYTAADLNYGDASSRTSKERKRIAYANNCRKCV